MSMSSYWFLYSLHWCFLLPELIGKMKKFKEEEDAESVEEGELVEEAGE